MSESITLSEVKKICSTINVGKLLKDSKQSYTEICRFGSITDRNQIKSIQETIRKHKLFDYVDEDQKHLWAFYGYIGVDDWVCIEVGSSDDILEEICGIVKLMYESPCDVDKRSVLHKDVVIYKSKSYTDKICYKYRYMNELFNEFWWIEINVDNHQDGNDNGYDKTNFAEVSYAVKNKALIWNPAPTTTDRKNRTNTEKQILAEVYKINS